MIISSKAKLLGVLHAVIIPALLWHHNSVVYGVTYHLLALTLYSTAFKTRAASLVFRTFSPIFLGVAHGYILFLLSVGHKILL